MEYDAFSRTITRKIIAEMTYISPLLVICRVLKENPSKQGIIFDRPPVVANAEKVWKDGMYHDASDRVTFVSGNFFDGSTLPPAQDGDAFYMRYILHDWGPDDCLRILRNLRKAIGIKKASLLIGEMAIPDRGVVGQPPTMYLVDLHMMAIFGDARERTPAQWKELLEAADFRLEAIHPTRSLLHWVEASPV